MIGTATSLENSAMISYPSVSVCSEDIRAFVAFADKQSPKEGIYDSWNSAVAHHETNVYKPYVIPDSPDMATLFKFINVNGANGTEFYFNPSKHNESRDPCFCHISQIKMFL